uniref:MAK10-like protein n=1 Tax=Tanacetum cinerariifolium TaxID=118510 RepID=A0A699GJ90_TANCI|nr:MAK10-like protein [Tanacetum cinerariifolium]
MGDVNSICTLGDYSRPSYKCYRNTIELPEGHNVEPLRSDTIRTIDQSASGKLRDRNAKESWAFLKDLALYDNESWNDPMDFAKPVKEISLPQDVSGTSDRYPIELENQVQRLMEAHLAPRQPIQVNKITSSSTKKPQNDESEEEDQEERINPGNINATPPSPHDPSILFITEKVCKLDSFFESSELVPQSSGTKSVCTKGGDEDVMFIEIIRKNDDSLEEGPRDEGSAMIEGDINSIIDPRLSQVVLGKPFVEISNMTHDPPEGVVRFTNRTDEIAYKMPHMIEQYNLLSDLEIEHIKSVYLRNQEDKKRGVEYMMSKILGFYKECLELRLKYLTGVADKGDVT